MATRDEVIKEGLELLKEGCDSLIGMLSLPHNWTEEESEMFPDPVNPNPPPQPERVIRSRDDIILPIGADPGHYLGSLTGDNDPSHNRPLPAGTRWKDGTPYNPSEVQPPTGPDVTPGVPNPAPSRKPIDIRSPEVNDTDWLSSQWLGNVEQFVREDAQSEEGTSVFILYDAPDRDNGNYSAGGVKTLDQYQQVVEAVRKGVGDDEAIVVIEPDALGLLDGLNEPQQELRLKCIRSAVMQFAGNPNTRTYVDASMWVDPHEMALRLDDVGAEGFSLNISGWESIEECYRYGDKVAELTGLNYVIDTSRNGNGNPHKPAWCNVTDTKVGSAPTTKTNSRKCDALIHGKKVGESDGLKINGWDGDGKPSRTDVPRAGEPWPEFKQAITTGDWTAFHQKYGTR